MASHSKFAMTDKGDVARGAQLFASETAACSRCHTVTGVGKGCGPDLLGIGDKYPRADLIKAVLEPSWRVLPGYGTVVAVLHSGDAKTGILWSRGKGEVELFDAENKPVRLREADIAALREEKTSLMPAGLEKSMSAEDFASLITYLESLKQPPLDALGLHGMPEEIVPIKHPIELVPFHSPEHRFEKPVWFSPMPVLENVFVVLEHMRARIWLLEKRPEGDRKALFADLDDEVSDGNFEGLVAIAFHPDFQENRRYFLKHEVMENDARATVLVERQASEDFRKDSGTPSRRLLHIPQPAGNHNGGTIAFGPDGYLYIAMGDGGPQEDPNGYSQSLREFLGSLARIDVDRRDDGKPYGIPPDNPWVKRAAEGVLPELWATGLRAPWRFSFDPLTGHLWVADVGQLKCEEVTIVRAGENHGWNIYEGFLLFSPRYRREEETYIPPVFAYARKYGVSVTGGHVYRGDPKSSYYGVYIFGDFVSRSIWGLKQKDRRLVRVREIGRCPEKIASFGVDREGEIYLVGYEPGTLFRLDLSKSDFDEDSNADAEGR